MVTKIIPDICKQCGTPLIPDLDTKYTYRTRCLNCGSIARNVTLTVRDSFILKDIPDAKKNIDSLPTILLKTIIIPGDKTSEGCIIEAVSIPWIEIIKFLVRNPNLVFQIPADKWEEIVAGGYKVAGFDEVILTPRSGDLGRDVIATKKGIGQIRVIDQVKAYKPGHLVKANDVRALMGVIQGDRASKGFLTTTSDFAPKIQDDHIIQSFIPDRLELINGPSLLNRLKELAS